MKLGKIVASAATAGVLLSGAFMVAEEYTGQSAFAVNLDNTRIDIKAKKGTVREVLITNNIPFGADDRVEPGLDTKVKGGETINIYRAREITIVDNGKETTRKTTYTKVEDILKELNITLGSDDKVTPSLDSEVATVDTIKITRVNKDTETRKEAVKFETKEEKDDSKYVDEKVTKVEGKDGEKEVTVEAVKEDGKVVSEKVVSEKVISEPTTKVVLVGTKQRPAAETSTATYTAKTAGGSIVLRNGNTAGATGSAAAQEMARRTGVPASTWEAIIARESNGQVHARNASGASGLFQTMPGWGSTATVQDQINAATRAYKAQGLSAWGMR
ncbi:transglycosylase [Gemella sp. oral taxon 928]|nr:transglycosylase [Gemella sp. oral taxon 928]AXI26283.1 transglycosylase [Gemella sp. ND 6198]